MIRLNIDQNRCSSKNLDTGLRITLDNTKVSYSIKPAPFIRGFTEPLTTCLQEYFICFCTVDSQRTHIVVDSKMDVAHSHYLPTVSLELQNNIL